VLIYIMNSTGIFPPSADYLRVIQEGYRDFCMPQKAYRLLHAAVRASWDDKAPRTSSGGAMNTKDVQNLRCRGYGSAAIPTTAITLATNRFDKAQPGSIARQTTFRIAQPPKALRGRCARAPQKLLGLLEVAPLT
jgi:hypothetical protein